jgi:hypothetical protein
VLCAVWEVGALSVEYEVRPEELLKAHPYRLTFPEMTVTLFSSTWSID